MTAAAVGWIATAFSTAAAVDSAIQSRRAAKKQDRLNELEIRTAAYKAARERRKQAQQQRAAQAQIQNTAQGAGLEGSTAAIASFSNVQSMASENIGTINTTLATNTLRSRIQHRIFELQQPSVFGQIATIGDAAASGYAQNKKPGN